MKKSEAAEMLRERAEIIKNQITNESNEFAVALEMGAEALTNSSDSEEPKN